MNRISFFILCIIALIFGNNTINGQNSSYQVSLDSLGYVGREVLVNENDDIVSIFSDPYTSYYSMYFIDFSGSLGGNMPAYKVSVAPPPPIPPLRFIRRAFYNGNKILLAQHVIPPLTSNFNKVIISIDVNTGLYWVNAYSFDKIDFAIDGSGDSLMVAAATPDNLLILKLLESEAGNEIWQKSFSLSKPAISSYKLESVRIQRHPIAGYFISGIMSNIDSTGNDESFIIQLDFNGMPIRKKSLGIGHRFDELIVSDDGIYVLGRTKTSIQYADNEENLILAKFDLNLDPVWTRIFYAEEFEFNNANLSVGNDGLLTLAYSTFGFFPTILAKLDDQGEVIWEKGYPLYQPQLDVLSDGSLLMFSQVYSGIPFNWQNIIGKTDTLGNIEGCSNFESCLESIHVLLNTDVLEVEEVNITHDTVGTLDLLIEPFELSFSDYCDIPPEPTPSFSAPDTICIMDSITATDLGNVHAHGIRWRLLGNGIDSIWVDSLEFRYRFLKAGTYTLSQSIWYLGCEHSFEKNITVLPPLEISIDKEGDFCEPPVSLEVQSNRFIRKYEWDNGDTIPSIEVVLDGLYSVTVSDGYCMEKDEVEITFVTTSFGNQPPLDILPDTTICNDDLPYTFVPQSSFADEFLLDLIPQSGLPLLIEEKGNHTVSIQVKECLFSTAFELDVKNCDPQIYFPNIFSPNNDGINDVFIPQGINFSPIRLLVFDRWGGLMHDSELGLFYWDGKDAAMGVYTFAFDYINDRTGKIGRDYGTITLIR